MKVYTSSEGNSYTDQGQLFILHMWLKLSYVVISI